MFTCIKSKLVLLCKIIQLNGDAKAAEVWFAIDTVHIVHT